MSIKRIYLADQPLINRIDYKMNLRQQELSKLSMSQHLQGLESYQERKRRCVAISRSIISSLKSLQYE